jgi:hypothetical protein
LLALGAFVMLDFISLCCGQCAEGPLLGSGKVGREPVTVSFHHPQKSTSTYCTMPAEKMRYWLLNYHSTT